MSIPVQDDGIVDASVSFEVDDDDDANKDGEPPAAAEDPISWDDCGAERNRRVRSGREKFEKDAAVLGGMAPTGVTTAVGIASIGCMGDVDVDADDVGGCSERPSSGLP